MCCEKKKTLSVVWRKRRYLIDIHVLAKSGKCAIFTQWLICFTDFFNLLIPPWLLTINVPNNNKDEDTHPNKSMYNHYDSSSHRFGFHLIFNQCRVWIASPYSIAKSIGEKIKFAWPTEVWFCWQKIKNYDLKKITKIYRHEFGILFFRKKIINAFWY